MNIEIHYDEEWAALYVDGKLQTVGDSYVAEEQALAMCGVKTVHDGAFMRGQNKREGVAQTLEELEDWKAVRELNRERAANFREQAAELMRRAAELEV